MHLACSTIVRLSWWEGFRYQLWKGKQTAPVSLRSEHGISAGRSPSHQEDTVKGVGAAEAVPGGCAGQIHRTSDSQRLVQRWLPSAVTRQEWHWHGTSKVSCKDNHLRFSCGEWFLLTKYVYKRSHLRGGCSKNMWKKSWLIFFPPAESTVKITRSSAQTPPETRVFN